MQQRQTPLWVFILALIVLAATVGAVLVLCGIGGGTTPTLVN